MARYSTWPPRISGLLESPTVHHHFIVGTMAVPNLGEQSQLEEEFVADAKVQSIIDVDRVIRLRDLVALLDDLESLVVLILRDDAF
jgi:hypothetical protein